LDRVSALSTPFQVTIVCWFVLEVALVVRDVVRRKTRLGRDRGTRPYHWVRHPSYTGLLLICLGFGIGIGNWLSVLICAVGPLLGLLPRIAVEETELVRVLGEQYRGYQKTTHRLIPGLW
jgi:protein-S-isoprenylcysteine O-methyltransferase Ste14